jgi:hypothetical protein
MIPLATITPSLEQVASHLLSRTVDRHGNRLGTFTSATTPTDVDARIKIAEAARHVAMVLGQRRASWNPDVIDAAIDAVASRAALKIESAYFRDRADADIDQLGRLAREELMAVVSAVRGGPVSVQLASPYGDQGGDTSNYLDDFLGEPSLANGNVDGGSAGSSYLDTETLDGGGA